MARVAGPSVATVQNAIKRRSLLSYFSDEPYLHGVVTKLLAADIHLVEDLSALTKDEIRSLLRTTPKNESRLFEKLRSDGIGFRKSAA